MEDLNRRAEDHFREITQLRERNQELETEMAKVARVGKLEEVSFADEARTWAGKSKRAGVLCVGVESRENESGRSA
jgi:hypothetical protein